ncbi:MAG: NAD-dependent epimerase/dehydratase family protein, partial [Desulfuromusa sp.]|nr:NAD-dependent epimerase/dehydratase family protein [Desulfuromusa sp.]
MLIAITGGTGFIGENLAMRCLSQGDDVRILSRKVPCERWLSLGVEWHQGDLEDSSCLLPFVDGVDVLYHCAGQLTDAEMMQRLHVEGTRHLIEAASGRIGHWVQLSSVGVYGPVSAGEITEESSINPVGEYEITKAESDALVLEAASQARFSCTILRPS